MEAEHVAARGELRSLLQTHPEWSHRQLAETIGYSKAWVKKWRKRLQAADPMDDSVLWGQSRARHQLPPCIAPPVVQRILTLREELPEHLGRIPGPKALLYYLHQADDLKAQGYHLPTSTSTIWRILDEHHCIARPIPIDHTPLERPEPLTHWQMDFKDVTTATQGTTSKKQHQIETLNFVDCGTSILVEALVREDFTMETALLSIAQALLFNGLPDYLTCDRDPRFVGSDASRDFPSPLLRFLYCLGITPVVCPPHRPDLNPFVERYHRSYNAECLQRYRPATLEQARQVTADYQTHYNHTRPHQGPSCGNRPPFEAFPQLPRRPALPDRVDPDAWLQAYHRRTFARQVQANGSLVIDDYKYYVGKAWRGQRVIAQVDAHAQEWVVYSHQEVLNRLPIKGLIREELSFENYLTLMCGEARRRHEHEQRRKRRYVRLDA